MGDSTYTTDKNGEVEITMNNPGTFEVYAIKLDKDSRNGGCYFPLVSRTERIHVSVSGPSTVSTVTKDADTAINKARDVVNDPNATEGQVSDSEVPQTARSQIPANSPVIDLGAKVGGENISSFGEPMEVSIPYTINENEDPAEITVFLLKDDGAVEPVGGQYDPVTGTVKFITNHFSKYFAKQSVKNFTDLEKYQWAEKTIEIMAGKGIIAGRTQTQFDPGAGVTRAEFAALAARMLKYEATDSVQIPFKDVGKDKWYYGAVAAAYAKGLMNGKSDAQFDPDGNITRQEMAVIIAKVLGKKSYKPAGTAELKVFTDRAGIAKWAEESVALATREGIIKGMSGGEFAPQENATAPRPP